MHKFLKKIFTKKLENYSAPPTFRDINNKPRLPAGCIQNNFKSFFMITNLPNLFGFTKLDKRKTPVQKEFERSNLDFLLKVREIIYESFQDLHTKVFSLFGPSDMDKNMPAVAMISFIRKGIIKYFPDYCRTATRKRFKLVTPNNEYVYVKKLDDNMRPSNIETNANNIILHQLTTDKKDKGPNIFVGYTTTSDYSTLTGIYAVCIDGDTVVWRTDISDLYNDQAGAVVTMKPVGTPPKLKSGVVKVRRTKKE